MYALDSVYMLYMLKPRGTHVIMSSSSCSLKQNLLDLNSEPCSCMCEFQMMIVSSSIAKKKCKKKRLNQKLTLAERLSWCYHTLRFRCHKTYSMKLLLHIFFSHFLENLAYFYPDHQSQFLKHTNYIWIEKNM